MAIAFVVEESAARAPSHLFVVKASFPRYVCEGSITIIVEQNVVAPKTAEEIVPSVVVIVSDANSCLPARACDSGFFCDVCERSVTIVLVEVCRGCLPRRPWFSES